MQDVQPILNSFFLVLAGEMGDKTQLLALILAARFRKPWTIMAGILIATLINHGVSAWAGAWISSQIPPHYLRYGLAAVFFAFAAWILVPDKDEELKETGHFGALVTTIIAFFLAEMGDKTQLATVALGATYKNLFAVTTGTTAGMLVADGLAVFFGERLTTRVPMKWVRILSSILFALFGIGILASGTGF